MRFTQIKLETKQKGHKMTTLQIITTTRTGKEYGPEWTIDGSFEDNLDELIGRLLDEKPEQLISDIQTKGSRS